MHLFSRLRVRSSEVFRRNVYETIAILTSESCVTCITQLDVIALSIILFFASRSRLKRSVYIRYVTISVWETARNRESGETAGKTESSITLARLPAWTMASPTQPWISNLLLGVMLSVGRKNRLEVRRCKRYRSYAVKVHITIASIEIYAQSVLCVGVCVCLTV